MPVIKSAKKRMKQNKVRRDARVPFKNRMKTMFKKALLLGKEGKAEELAAYLPKFFSAVDTCAKKRIIHENTAARKKSRVARVLAGLQNKGTKSKTEAKAA